MDSADKLITTIKPNNN